MPATTVDKLLKGLEDLGSLDLADLDMRLADLEDQQRVLQVKLSTLRLLRQSVAEVAPALETPEPAPDEGVEARSGTWKSDAVLAVLRQDPARALTPVQVRNQLRAEGQLTDDEGTTTSVVLRRLAKRGKVIHEDGTYRFREPVDASRPIAIFEGAGS
jgi:hypothetical protein